MAGTSTNHSAHMRGKTAKSSHSSPAKSNLTSQSKSVAGIKTQPIHKTASRLTQLQYPIPKTFKKA